MLLLVRMPSPDALFDREAAMKEQDKQEVRTIFREEVSALLKESTAKPTPWYKTPLFTGSVALAALLITVSQFLINHWNSDTSSLVKSEIREALRPTETRVYEHSQDIASIKGSLAEIRDFIKILTERRLKAMQALPKDQFKAALPELRRVVESATKLSLPIDRGLLTQVVSRATSLAKDEDPGQDNPAWAAAQAALASASTLNTESLINKASIKVHPQHGQWAWITMPPVPGRQFPKYNFGGAVSGESRALFELISRPMNRPEDPGPELVVLEGGAVQIDNIRARHVILKDVDVFYSGGPVIFEDVVFVNCRFHFKNTESSRDLALAIAKQPVVTFST